VGEIGLDYHYDHSPRDIQARVFRRQWITAGRGAALIPVAAKHAGLYVPRRMIVVIIESDFTPRDNARMPRQPVEFLVMRIGRMPRLMG